MLTTKIKTAFALVFLLTGLAVANTAQAVCIANATTNYPGVLGNSSTAKDIIKFTCPVTYPKLKFAVRKKSGGTVDDYVVAKSGAPTCDTTRRESQSNGTAFGPNVVSLASNAISIEKDPKISGTRMYELCVECLNATCTASVQPSSAIYLQNQ